MKNVLRITTSILGEGSVSSQLMAELVTKLGTEEALKVTERNFANQAIPHLDGPWLTALSTAHADRSPEQQAKVAFSDQLITELQAADILVIGLPMYNFSLPSMLKAWVDHIARAGVTFKYTDNGSVGLLGGKKVYLVAAMGGIHETGATDFLRPYMKQVLDFVGLSDVEFVTADGLNMGPERREQGLNGARRQIGNIQSIATQEVAA
ncbi:MAG: FMN-dependent NADH-azoreductase [SAR86 cluster bacterium]|uniref:FMN dependent NADH:quinone oxidoreductase n=1 Tax=SAR86 cluster bacterium TaxID=2030880 RepID=A0A2A4WUJ1_9GAMM|nr:MAG: FMN-dependent NADH-azoreductase [SAR86 cluster bacterium]